MRYPSGGSGWGHIYKYEADGSRIGAVTSGEWEMRGVKRVDEERDWIYFTDTKDSHIQSHLYRVHLDGEGLERLTAPGGSHRVNLDPTGTHFIDSWSDHASPAKVALFRTNVRAGVSSRRSSPGVQQASDSTRADRAGDSLALTGGGSSDRLVRVLDTNPVRDLEKYDLGRLELVQIEMSDGFLLEGSILTPPDFDPSVKHPVWFMTYGGPHSPTISDSSSRRRARDEMLANMGIAVFRGDPRSARRMGAERAARAACGLRCRSCASPAAGTDGSRPSLWALASARRTRPSSSSLTVIGGSIQRFFDMVGVAARSL